MEDMTPSDLDERSAPEPVCVGRQRSRCACITAVFIRILNLDLVTAVVKPPGGISSSDLRERLFHRLQQSLMGARTKLS